MINESTLAVAAKKLCGLKQSTIIETADQLEKMIVGFLDNAEDWTDQMDAKLNDEEIMVVCTFYVGCVNNR